MILNFDFTIDDKNFNDSLKINIRKLMEYIPKYDEKGHTIEKEPCVLPASFDDYELNYLEESEPRTKQIIGGYSMKNKVKQYGFRDHIKSMNTKMSLIRGG